MEEQLIRREWRRRYVHYLRLVRHFWLLLRWEPRDNMSSANPSRYNLDFRKRHRYDNDVVDAYIKHVGRRYRGGTSVEVMALSIPSQQEGIGLDCEEDVLTIPDMGRYLAPSPLTSHDHFNLGPLTHTDVTHAARSSRKVAPSTQKSYGTITGRSIHAGDHNGDFYDNRTTVNATCKSNLTWVGIGSDMLSRTAAGLTLHALGSYLVPRNATCSNAQTQYAATGTSSAPTYADAMTQEGRGATKQAKALSAGTRANEGLATDSNVKWIQNCMECCTISREHEFAWEEVIHCATPQTPRATAMPTEEQLDFHHQTTTPHTTSKEICNDPLPVSKGKSARSATQCTKQHLASSESSTAASTEAPRVQQESPSRSKISSGTYSSSEPRQNRSVTEPAGGWNKTSTGERWVKDFGASQRSFVDSPIGFGTPFKKLYPFEDEQSLDDADIQEQKGNVDTVDAQCERNHIESSEPHCMPPSPVFPKSCAAEDGSENSAQPLRPPRTEPILRPCPESRNRRPRTGPSDSALNTQPGGGSSSGLGRSIGLPTNSEGVGAKLEQGFKLHTEKKAVDTVFR